MMRCTFSIRRVLLIFTLLLLVPAGEFARATPISDGVTLWLDATDSATVIDPAGSSVASGQFNGTVSNWLDKSPNMYHASQADLGRQPQYSPDAVGGRAAVHFDGADDFFSVDPVLSFGGAITVFTAYEFRSNSGKREGIFSGTTQHSFEMWAGGDDGPLIGQAFVNRVFPTTFDDRAGVPFVLGASFDGVNATFSLNGMSETKPYQLQNGAWSPSNYIVGRSAFEGNGTLNGYMSELLIYNRALDANERSQVESYLLGKYDVNEPLPDPIQWTSAAGGNGHHYQFVEDLAGLTWDEAKAAAETLSWNGTAGHLLTLGSQTELDFVQNNLPVAADAWLGAAQDLAAPDYSEPAGGWRWVTGEPFDFDPWSTPANGGNDAEPNNHGGSEDAMRSETSLFNGETVLRANDAPAAARTARYYVEFPTIGPPFSTWTIDASGNWSQPANWTAGVPNGVGAAAIFGPVISAQRTVSVDAAVTVGRIEFNSDHTYIIGGTGPITLDAAAGDVHIGVVTGSHTISAPIALADNTTITVTPSASNLSLNGAFNASGKSVTKAGAGTLTLNNLRAAGLSITGGAVAIAPNGTAAATSVVGVLIIPGGASPTATLDLNNNAAIIDHNGTSPAQTLRHQIISGRGGSGLGNPWTGQGITSSSAATANATQPESRSIGYAENSALPLGPYTTFRGQPVDETSILMAYTRTGDANIDGLVNDDDVTIVGANYAPGVPQPHWSLGDFDYNGFVDDDDVTLLGAFYDPAAAPLASVAADTSAVAAIPEPESWVLLASSLIVLSLFAFGRCFSRGSIHLVGAR